MDRSPIGKRSPSSDSRSQSSNPIVVYERCINNYKRDIKALHDQIHELQNRIKANESPDNVLIQTCTNLQTESQRLNEEIVNLRNRNIELSNKIANDSTFECLEQNKKLTTALQEANQREETLIEKYKRSSYKFKELKNQFENTTTRYKELIREKKESDEKQIELIKANQNLENTIKGKDAELQKHKDSLNKVMKHYLDAKSKKLETEKKLTESIEQNKKIMVKLEEKQGDIEKHKENILSKEREIKNLKDEIEQHKSDFQELTEKVNLIEEDKQRLLNVETELVESRENNDHLVTQLKSFESENLAISQQVIELKEDLNSKKESLRDSKKRISDLNAELDQIYAEKAQIEEDLHRYQIELNSIQEEKKDLQIKIQKEEEEADRLNEEIEELKSQNDQFSEEVERLKPFESDCAQYLVQIENLQKEKEEIQSNNINLNDANLELRKKGLKMKEKLNGLKIELSEQQMLYDKLVKEDNDLKDEYDSILKDNQILRSQNEKFKNDINSMTSQINTLSLQVKEKNSQYSVLLNNFTQLKDKETEIEEEKTKIAQTMNAKLDELKRQNRDITELLNRSQKQVAENREMSDKLSLDYDKLSKQYVKLLQLNHADVNIDDDKQNKSYYGNYRFSRFHSANNSPVRKNNNNNRYQPPENKNYSLSSLNSISQIHSHSRSPSPTRSPLPSPSPIRPKETNDADLIKSLSAKIRDLQNENNELRDQLEMIHTNDEQQTEEEEENRYTALLDSLNESRQENELLRDELDRIKSSSLHSIEYNGNSTEITNDEFESDSFLKEVMNENKMPKEKIAQLEKENKILQEQLNRSNREINENSKNNSKRLTELQKKVTELNHQLIQSPDRKKFDETQKERDQLLEENSSLKSTVHALQYQLKGMENTPLLTNTSYGSEKPPKSPSRKSGNSSFSNKNYFNEDEDRNIQKFPPRKKPQPPADSKEEEEEEDSNNFFNENTASRSTEIKNMSKTPNKVKINKVNKNKFSTSLPISDNKPSKSGKSANPSLSPGKKIIIAKNRKEDKLMFHEIEFNNSEEVVEDVVRIQTKVGKGASDLPNISISDDENDEEETEGITSEEIESINKIIQNGEKLISSDTNEKENSQEIRYSSSLKQRKLQQQQQQENNDDETDSEQVNQEILNQYASQMSPPPLPGNVFNAVNDNIENHSDSYVNDNGANSVEISNEEEELEEGSEEGELIDNFSRGKMNYQKLADIDEEEEDEGYDNNDLLYE